MIYRAKTKEGILAVHVKQIIDCHVIAFQPIGWSLTNYSIIPRLHRQDQHETVQTIYSTPYDQY